MEVLVCSIFTFSKLVTRYATQQIALALPALHTYSTRKRVTHIDRHGASTSTGHTHMQDVTFGCT